jgi:hypothetical protein
MSDATNGAPGSARTPQPDGPRGAVASGRGRTLLAALALVLGLALLASTLAQGPPIWMLLQPGEASRMEIVASLTLLWGGGLVLVVLVAAVVRGALRSLQPHPPTYGAILMRGVPLATVSLVVLSLVTIGWMEARGSEAIGAGFERTGEGSERRGPGLGLIDWWNSSVVAGEDRRQPTDPAAPGRAPDGRQYALLGLALVLAVALAALMAWQWHARRRTLPGRSAEKDAAGDLHPAEVQGAVVSTIDAMLADPDPRAAIIGAYARLLEGLSACGAGRREHEAPFEHLHRVLAVLQVRSGPMRRLTGLFAAARFSTHPPTKTDREEALTALREIALDLGGPAGRMPAESVRPEVAQP